MEKIRKVCGMLSIKNFLLLTVAGIVNAFGVVIFLAPVKLYDSGISGIPTCLPEVRSRCAYAMPRYPP